MSNILSQPAMTLDIVIWSMFLGIVGGAFYSFYIKSVLGAFVRRLLTDGALSPETARGLDETGFAGNIFVRRALREGGAIRKVVRTVGETAAREAGEAAEVSVLESEGMKIKSLKTANFNPLTARFYIPEDLRYRADIMFDTKGTSLPVALIAVLAFLVAAMLSFAIIPDLVQMAKNAFSSF